MRSKRAPLWGAAIILIIVLLLTTIHYKIKSTQLSVAVNEQIIVIEKLEAQILESQVSELEEKNQPVKENSQPIEAPTSKVVTANSNDFKSYMSYKAIKTQSSKQWQLQQVASTDENGFRCINGTPLVAVGTGWGLSVGDYAVVSCDNGNKFTVVIGDIKSDRHTSEDNKTTSSNNCRCEFIVDVDNLHSTVKRLGNAAVLQEYSGYVINIEGIK